MLKLHELRERKATLVDEMRAVLSRAESETRDLTTEEDRRFGELKTELAAVDKSIARAEVVEAAERSMPSPAGVSRVGDGDFEERCRKNFSVRRALAAALPRDLGGGNEDAALERELGEELQRRSGGKQFVGVPIPYAALEVESRTLLAGSTAADLIPNLHRADLFIQPLRSALVTERLGATVLSDLAGSPIDIPRQVSSSVAAWVAEDGALSETDPGFDDLSLTPKTCGAMTSYSRRTLLNASPSIENILRMDLSKVIANEIDKQAMIGTGENNTPTGITNVDGAIEVTTGPTLDWAGILEFISVVEGANALEGSLGWAINPFVKAKLRATTKVSGDAAAGFLMDGTSELGGYRAIATNALPGEGPDESPLPEGHLIFGNWADLIIGRWGGGVDVLLNPYADSYYSRGRVGIRAMVDVDVQVRHAESFAYAQSLTTQ